METTLGSPDTIFTNVSEMDVCIRVIFLLPSTNPAQLVAVPQSQVQNLNSQQLTVKGPENLKNMFTVQM